MFDAGDGSGARLVCQVGVLADVMAVTFALAPQSRVAPTRGECYLHGMEFLTKPHWTGDRRALWERIAAHPFEAPGTPLDFTRRIAREKSWTLAYTRQVIDEYRRFCFLSVVQGSPVTPSEDVDEVWHKHLTYSRDYWDVWCGRVLGHGLHHDPTEGGPAEDRKFREQYARTLVTYEAWFGPPPEAFWPSSQRQFGHRPRFRTIDTERMFVLPRPRFSGRWALGLLAMAAFPASAMAQMANPLDWGGAEFLRFFFGCLILVGILTICARHMLRGVGPAVHGGALNATETAFLAGGPQRAFATAMLEAMARGNVSVAADGLIAVKSNTTVSGLLAPYVTDGARYAGVRAAAAPAMAAIRGMLEQRGLVLTKARRATMSMVTFLLFAPLFVLGLEKTQVGLDRDRPVGFLIFLLFLTGLVALIMAFRRPFRSRAGDALVSQMRAQMKRLTRAPLESELALALALGGVGVLVGTPYAALGMSVQRAGGGGSSSGCGSDGGSGSSGGGDSGGGDSGGSSGCGGCSSSSSC